MLHSERYSLLIARGFEMSIEKDLLVICEGEQVIIDQINRVNEALQGTGKLRRSETIQRLLKVAAKVRFHLYGIDLNSDSKETYFAILRQFREHAPEYIYFGRQLFVSDDLGFWIDYDLIEKERVRGILPSDLYQQFYVECKDERNHC